MGLLGWLFVGWIAISPVAGFIVGAAIRLGRQDELRNRPRIDAKANVKASSANQAKNASS
jgi:hypothetical protein